MTSPSSRRVSRRQFGATLGLTGVAALASTTNAQLPVSPVDAKFDNVIRKYGDRLTEEQRKSVRLTIARHERMLARIRTFPLDNADPPATGFRP